MALPDYNPPTYEVWDVWNSGKKRKVLQTGVDMQSLKKEEFVRSCLISETGSVKNDLSDEAKIRSFAKQAADFDTGLIGVLNRWATYPDQEYIRDGISVDGKTASSLMWEHGITFTDVVSGIQTLLEHPERYEVQSVTVSANGPETRLSEDLLTREPESAGFFGRLKRLFPAEPEQTKRESAAALFGIRAGEVLSGKQGHNRMCLCAEQAVKQEEEKLRLYAKAEKILTEKSAWYAQIAERTRGMDGGALTAAGSSGDLIEISVDADTSGRYEADSSRLLQLKTILRENEEELNTSYEEAKNILSEYRSNKEKTDTDPLYCLETLEEQLKGTTGLSVLQAANGMYGSGTLAETGSEEMQAFDRLLEIISGEQAERSAKEQAWKESLQKTSAEKRMDDPERGKERKATAERSEHENRMEEKERIRFISLSDEETGKKKKERPELGTKISDITKEFSAKDGPRK